MMDNATCFLHCANCLIKLLTILYSITLSTLYSFTTFFALQILTWQIMSAVQSTELEMLSIVSQCKHSLPARVWLFPAPQLLSYPHTECSRPLSLCCFGDVKELGVVFFYREHTDTKSWSFIIYTYTCIYFLAVVIPPVYTGH